MDKLIALYHYYHPDDVAGALQYSGLCEKIASNELEVEVWPSNRSCHHEDLKYSIKPEFIDGVLIRRFWRPTFDQHSFYGRILNSIWIEIAWIFRALFTENPRIVILGTDPIFAVLTLPLLKLIWPGTKFVHWCFDLYPDYAVANEMISEKNPATKILRLLLSFSYRKFDLTVDLGACMDKRLKSYSVKKSVILTPWSLEEPSEPLGFDKTERKRLFGNASLALLYSGNLSQPHEFQATLKLARIMREVGVFVFGTRGSRTNELLNAIDERDINIRFAPFIQVSELVNRLSAPDIHIVSLKESFTGVTIPSKFFGALAVGRPVLFEGNENSNVATWIKELGLGWVLNDQNVEEVAADLTKFMGDPKRKSAIFRKCHEVYQKEFSKKVIVEKWKRELEAL